MRRSLPVLILVALLVLSIGGNVALFQQATVGRAEADRYRQRARAALEERSTLLARIEDLVTEIEQLRIAAAAAPERPTTAPAAPAAPAASARSGARSASQETTSDRQTLERIADEVSGLRGLPRSGDVPMRFMDRQRLRQYFVDTFEKDYLPHERESDQKLLLALGLFRPSDDLMQILLDLLQEQVIGTFNEEENAIYIIQDEGRFGPEEKLTFAHEYVHALQHHHYDLTKLAPKHPDNADRSLAVHAMIEGDATLLQRLWMQEHLSPEEIAELSQGGGGSKLDRAPLIVQRELLFPYLDGLRFVREAHQRAGGFEGVDALYRYPPDSTEQVLHPEKYRAREKPVEVTLPDLAAALGEGWRTIGSNVLGELDFRILVEQYGSANAAERAAAGWGGDRWQLVEKDGQLALVLKSTWDSDDDAREFFSAYANGLKKRFASARQEAATPERHALTATSWATELRRSGRDVLAVIAYDRPTAERLVALLGW